ncbi:spermidine synthase, partial [Verrucomicrobiota bacterium]
GRSGRRGTGVSRGKGVHLAWFLLSLAACASLLAVTNVITFDVASVPFLWILPLSVYLLAFVVTFKRNPWFPKCANDLLYWAVALGVVLHLVTQLHLFVPPAVSLVLQLLILSVLCLNCAGVLAKSKPEDPEQLTTFYVVLALGGLVGSFLVAWVMPVVSSSLVEFPAALVLVTAAAGACCVSRGAWRENQNLNAQRPTEEHLELDSCPERSRRVGRSICIPVVVVVAAVVGVPWLAGRIWDDPNAPVLVLAMGVPVFLAIRYAAGKPWQCAAILLAATIGMHWTEDLVMGAGRVKRLRNFYGIYKIFDKGELRYLQHGTTQHGRQYLSGPERQTPLGYYHPTTPAAEVLTSDEFHFEQIGMVGLGTGALTCYTGSNQVFTVYELDPDNLEVARENFSYIEIAEKRGVDFRFVSGDGRLSIKSRARAQRATYLDLLIVDAFNSGSIPVHLLTVEALRDYAEALAPDGILLIHVSNKILELRPVLESNASAAGLAVCHRDNAGRTVPDAEETYWMAFSRDPGVTGMLVTDLGWWKGRTPAEQLPRPWTDRYSNLLGAVRWR